MKRYNPYLFNETERQFYKKFKIFPDELHIQLLQLGFPDAFKDIQKQMDDLFQIQKTQYYGWNLIDVSPFDTQDGATT